MEDKRVDGSRRTVSENPVLEKWGKTQQRPERTSDVSGPS